MSNINKVIWVVGFLYLTLVGVVVVGLNMDRPSHPETFIKGSDGNDYGFVEFNEQEVACVTPKGNHMVCFQYD